MKLSSTLLCNLGLAALLLAGAGCASVNTVSPAYPIGSPNKIADKRVITDRNLNDIAYVVEVDGAVVSGNLRQVQVMLQNTKAAVKNVDYRFQWFDAQGIAVNDGITKSISIEGGDTRPITDIAPSPAAVDWKLTLMESVRRAPGEL